MNGNTNHNENNKLQYNVKDGINKRIDDLLTALSKERIKPNKNASLMYNFLEVLFNELYPRMEEDDQKKGEQALEKLKVERDKVIAKYQHHSFTTMGNMFERELRTFIHKQLYKNIKLV